MNTFGPESCREVGPGLGMSVMGKTRTRERARLVLFSQPRRGLLRVYSCKYGDVALSAQDGRFKDLQS